MKRLVSLILAVSLFAVTRGAQAGKCRIDILLDHTQSMMTQRQDGFQNFNKQPATRCWTAGMAVFQQLRAIEEGDFYDMSIVDNFNSPEAGIIHSTTDMYDINCPNVADRLVSIRVFGQYQMTYFDENLIDHLTVTSEFPEGFVPLAVAEYLWSASNYTVFDPNFGREQPIENCNGPSTHLAESMCLTAQDFQGALAPGDIRQAVVLTDGGENASNLPGCRIATTDSTNPGAQGSGGWGDRVTAMYLSRGIKGYGFMFQPNSTQGSAAPQAFALASAERTMTAMTPATEVSFFNSWTNQTNGLLEVVMDTQPVAPSTMLVDSDGDGVPDFRDQCYHGQCADQDHDQIADANDQCPTQMEDGRWPWPSDGCADGDSDGILDGADQCPFSGEDTLLPLPYDGCPRLHAVAAPVASVPLVGFLGLGMLGLALVSLERARRERP